jgi:hypothetical protein
MKTAHKGLKRMGLLLVMLLVMLGMVSGASAGTNDLDGSKIEGVKVVWVTQDHAATAEGAATPQAELDDKAHLYLSSVSNGEMRMVYKIEAEFSGQYDYAPGDITITIPAKVTTIGNGAFARCAGLETVTMPDSVERLEHSCFYNCTSLRLVRLGVGLRVIGDSAFSRCVSLSQVELPEGLEEILPCALKCVPPSGRFGCHPP